MATAQLHATGISIHNVLIATDLSRQSQDILRCGMELRSAYGAHATILYVLPRDEYILAGFEAFATARDAARRDLAEMEESLGKQYSCERGKDYQVLLAEGDVAGSIFECAREKHIDLIVLGTHGRSGLSKAFVGSVAERVFRHADIPVLTIGPCAHSSLLSGPKRVLAPVDFTVATQHSAKYACALAREHQAELVLLHVVENVPKGAMADLEVLKHTVEQSLTELVGCEEKPQHMRVVTEVGKVVPTVLKVAAELDADLIVLGVHMYPKLLDQVRSQTAYELVRQAPCPVLTVR
jgi:nucleotide-binding universal stress UspA family protein